MVERRSVPWLNLLNQTFSMTIENFIDTSHGKLLISDILPRHTSIALAAHLCAATHRLGSTGLDAVQCIYNVRRYFILYALFLDTFHFFYHSNNSMLEFVLLPLICYASQKILVVYRRQDLFMLMGPLHLTYPF